MDRVFLSFCLWAAKQPAPAVHEHPGNLVNSMCVRLLELDENEAAVVCARRSAAYLSAFE